MESVWRTETLSSPVSNQVVEIDGQYGEDGDQQPEPGPRQGRGLAPLWVLAGFGGVAWL